MLKELLYTGMGAVAILKEKVEDELQKLEDQGKLKKDDVKSFIDSIAKKGEEEDAKLRESIKATLKEIIDELGLATKEDLKALAEDLSSKRP